MATLLVIVQTGLPIKVWTDDIFTRLAFATAQAPTLQKRHAYLEPGSMLAIGPSGAELHVILG